jgi:very-short-patch-repair endonuclease
MTNDALPGSGGQLARPFSDGELRSRVQSGFSVPSISRSLPEAHIEPLRRLLDDVGAPCWAWGVTAAGLHGFDGFDLRPPFHLAIPRARNLRRIGHVVHTVTQFEPVDKSHVHGVAASSPTRTIVELARVLDASQLTSALDSALRDGGTSEDFLHRRIVALRGNGRPGLSLLLAVIDGGDVTRGGHSWLEREFLRLLSDAGVAKPATQRIVGRRRQRTIRVDCRFEGTNVVVELLGYAFHRSPLQMQSDAERMNQMLLDGLRPFQFTYSDVVSRASHVVSTVCAALEPPGSGIM